MFRGTLLKCVSIKFLGTAPEVEQERYNTTMKKKVSGNARITIPAELKTKLAIVAEKKGMFVDEMAAYIIEGYLSDLKFIEQYSTKEEESDDPLGLPTSYPPSFFSPFHDR